MLCKRRGRIKSYLLDESSIAGTGDVFVQDLRWHARLHQLTPASELIETGVAWPHSAGLCVLQEGLRWDGGNGEKVEWGGE
jgi:formamidopyrimidine-DNA glycosylase